MKAFMLLVPRLDRRLVDKEIPEDILEVCDEWEEEIIRGSSGSSEPGLQIARPAGTLVARHDISTF